MDLRGNVTWMSPFQGKQRRCFTYMRDVQTSRELGKWTTLVLPTHEHLESRALTRPFAIGRRELTSVLAVFAANQIIFE